MRSLLDDVRLIGGNLILINAHPRSKDLWSLAAAERAVLEEDRRRGEGTEGSTYLLE